MKLTNNTILITGGGSGIGLGLAVSFLRLGNQVVIAGRNLQKLEEAADSQPGLEFIELDVMDPASIRLAAKELAERFPDLNVLVNNAGIMMDEVVLDGGTDIAERTIATSLMGPIRLTDELLPRLLERAGATVINVTSGLAFVPKTLNPPTLRRKQPCTLTRFHSVSSSPRRACRSLS